MHVVRTPASARAIARTLLRPVGFVPTMGALHRGHRTLVERAQRENASVAVSIFVNPLQFGPSEDYERYPRKFEKDAALLDELGVAFLYSPSVERMYAPGFSTRVNVGVLAERFEGAARPGHFDGVATVVGKLLHAIEPTTMYLGQKDAQQTAVLRRMIADLDVPVDVVVCPTTREADGLALSSRNAYLSAEERAAAPSLHRALALAAEALLHGQDPDVAMTRARSVLLPPLAWEYLSVVDVERFEPVRGHTRPALVIGAARAGAVRLIDNVSVAGIDERDPLVTPERDRDRLIRA
ncbi:MAG: pantoate--beta-alanine ligase [Candidatus Eremiobacteraeota bacterium]|nr:pantoate--beta-alanine ligase [Candidatus Eremiobacteraeota bacterium]